MPHILSTTEFTKDTVSALLARTAKLESQYKKGKVKKLLKDKVVACIFFEPSTRTRLSFETAALKLGASVISVENGSDNSSAKKGETIEDTTRTINCYADVTVMRHSEVGAAQRAASVSIKPVINAGDGAGEHPSQGLLDLYTIQKEQGRLENLDLTFVGDLKNSRTLHSLLPLLALYSGNTFHFVSPVELKLQEELKQVLSAKNISFTESANLEEVLSETDVFYMTRVQKERFASEDEYNKVKDAFLLKPEHLNSLKKEAIIMHPLPRVNEIDPAIDTDPRAAYFRQVQNGLYVRMALLLYALGM